MKSARLADMLTASKIEGIVNVKVTRSTDDKLNDSIMIEVTPQAFKKWFLAKHDPGPFFALPSETRGVRVGVHLIELPEQVTVYTFLRMTALSKLLEAGYANQ